MKKSPGLCLIMALLIWTCSLFGGLQAASAALDDEDYNLDAPYDLMASYNSKTASLELNWHCDSHIYEIFKVWRQEYGSDRWTQVAYGHEKSFQDNAQDLKANTIYVYRVSNEAGYSETASVLNEYVYSDPSSDGNDSAEATMITEEPAATVLEFTSGSLQYLVNGQPALMDAPPAELENHILLPIRYVVEALGGTASWEADSATVSIDCNGHRLLLWPEANTANVDGVSRPIDASNPAVTPVIDNNRLLIPLRFVGESLDCQVEWDPERAAALITYPRPGQGSAPSSGRIPPAGLQCP